MTYLAGSPAGRLLKERFGLQRVSAIGAGVLCLALLLLTGPANAMNIQKVTSPGGISAWLVEEKSVPLISMHFGFDGGATQDPDGKPGVSYFLSGMLDEGAGDLNSQAFQERMEDLAVKLSFDTTRDLFMGSLRTLTENKDQAFDLLHLAMSEPRFDQDAVDRIRSQILAGLKFDATDPSKVAAKNWFAKAFKGHPYALPVKGSVESLDAVTADDLRQYAKANFARDNLKVAVVGDIDAKTLGDVLDKTFGWLPEKASLKDVAEAKPVEGSSVEVVDMDVPQSVAEFGFPGIKRNDPDFMTAYVLNYIIGGGGFSSRLTEEVREKRGLAYSVYSYLYPYKNGAAYIGNVATKNADMGRSLDVIREIFTEMSEKGPSEEELKNAKQYLTGSYPLRFDTSSKISSQLMWIQVEELGSDYIDNRNNLINAVTIDDLKRVAKRLIDVGDFQVMIVGRPEGISSTGG